MLKVCGIEDAVSGQRLFQIREGQAPAPTESLEKVVLFAVHLLQENELAGTFQVSGDGVLALDLPPVERSFFYDGIVFAALDVFNNPTKNPTVTRLTLDRF